MKTKITLVAMLLFAAFTNAKSQITQTCFTENFDSPTTAGWTYSQGAKEGDFNDPSNACVLDRAIITPGVGGNNPANIVTPDIISAGPVSMQLKFEIFSLNSNLNCNSWADFGCPTSIDVFYWIGTNKYPGIADLTLPANGPSGQYKVTVNFNVGTSIPVGTPFKLELAFKPKSGIGNCNQPGTKYVIDDFSLCQITCSNCSIDAKDDVLCSELAQFTNSYNGDLSVNDTKYPGADVSYSLANGPFANGSSTTGGATLVINPNGTFTITRTDLTKTRFDWTYTMTDNLLGISDIANATFTFGPCGGPLPVVFNNFYTFRKNNIINLTWNTETEINVSGFEIQKKVGSEFVKVGFVSASNASTGSNYTYADNNSSSSLTEYRLKIVGTDGSFTYSDIRSVKGINSVNSFSIFPNPSNGDAKIVISDISNPINIKIIDNSGRIIKNITSSTSNSVQLSGLQKGIYLVRMVNSVSGESETKKLVVDK